MSDNGLQITTAEYERLKKIAVDHEAILTAQKDAQYKSEKELELKKVHDDLMTKLDAKEKEIEARIAAKTTPPIMTFGKGTKEKAGLDFKGFLGKVMGKDESIAHLKTAMDTSSSSGALGGYTVPVEYLQTIEGQITEVAKITPLCTKAIQKAPVSKLPKMLTNATVYWSTQGSGKSESNMTFAQGTLTLNYLYCLLKETNELMSDEIVNLPGFIENQVARLMNAEEDSQILSGSGSPFTGIVGATGINSVALVNGAKLTYQDIVNLVNQDGQLEEYTDRSTFVMRKSVLAILMNMVDGNNRPIWNLNTPLDGKLQSTILGYPYLKSPQIAATKIVFGDFSRVIVGEKEGETGLKVAFTDSATIGSDNLFEKNMVGFRFERRKSVLVAWPQAFSVLVGVA